MAVLCAHAAIEAFVNREAEARLPTEEWMAPEKENLPQKWMSLVLRLTRDELRMGQGLGQDIKRLEADRNLIAHFKGVRNRSGKPEFRQPPVAKQGGITAVRAYFDADRAGVALHTARAVMADFYRRIRESPPDALRPLIDEEQRGR